MKPQEKTIATIELENMEFYARHGCYRLEKEVGNRFNVNVSITYDATQAAAADDITRSVNYLEVYNVVREQMELTSDILENVAKRIADSLKERFPAIQKLTVRVSKIAPPLGGKVERVSVTVTL
ncbi:MAG: dihydroneopterin aldolase [Rikenellaceae bacterium]|nr:dihydroneopterin aldolase [Rikenellaceae bacterium]